MVQTFDTLRVTLFVLSRIPSLWQRLHGIPWNKRLYVLGRFIPRTSCQVSKIFTTYVGREWNTPIAVQATRTCKRLQKQKIRAFRKEALTEEQHRTFDTQIAHAILGAVFDSVIIQHVSTFAPRMGLYQLDEGTPVFKFSLRPEEVFNLMQQHVSAVCISYKHTRRSNDGLPKDIARIQRAVTAAANQLLQKRLLFWCDVIGHTPRGVSWAQQGIDPYLCMPTLRIISEERREEINDSFWMTIERLCARIRGGLLSYDEDEDRLQFGLPDEGYFTHIPNISSSFEYSKLLVAKLMCNPILYYRRARFEDDKLEVMKYAVSSVISSQMDLYQVQQNEAGLLRFSSEKDMHDFLAVLVIFIERDVDIDFIKAYLDRPQGEIIIEDGERWHGFQESVPATKILEPQYIEKLNRESRKGAFWIRRRSPPVDNITEVIGAPLWNSPWFSAMRLRVDGFREHEDHVTGKVVSFRVATEEEELSLTYKASIRKRICFD